MDVSRYLNKVDAKVENDRKKKEDELNAFQKRFDSLALEIYDLSERIRSVLEVGTYCQAKQITIPSRYNEERWTAQKHGYGTGDYGFIADGIAHHVGFFQRGERGKICGLAIVNGGACGPWTFRVNSDDESLFYWVHEDQRNHPGITNCPPVPRSLRDMEYFIKEFPLFEAAFYSWVDSLA